MGDIDKEIARFKRTRGIQKVLDRVSGVHDSADEKGKRS